MRYALKKTATMIITLFFVSVLVFFSFSLIPGNPAISKLGTEATPERIEALSHEMGLDKPVAQRFTEWIFGVIRGDFGKSYSYSQSVTSLLSDKIKTTLLLAFMAIIICINFNIRVIFICILECFSNIIESTIACFSSIFICCS